MMIDGHCTNKGEEKKVSDIITNEYHKYCTKTID